MIWQWYILFPESGILVAVILLILVFIFIRENTVTGKQKIDFAGVAMLGGGYYHSFYIDNKQSRKCH